MAKTVNTEDKDIAVMPPMEELVWVQDASKETGMSTWWITHNCDHAWKYNRRMYVRRASLQEELAKRGMAVESYRRGDKVQVYVPVSA